jgi:hypothetical protein
VAFRKIAFLAALLGGCVAFAQDSATLNVTVLDPSAALVPGAKVTLTDLYRGTLNQAETNDSGIAAFNLLQPGEYTFQVTKSGFDTYRVDRLVVRVRDRQILRVTLRLPSAAATSVEVTANAQPVSSDAAQGASLDQSFVQDLPVNGRNAESLILMTPGITSAAGGAGTDGGFNDNGLRTTTNYFTLDGVSMNMPVSPGGGRGARFGGGPAAATPGAGTSTTLISIDDTQEVKIQTSSFAPEFGRSPGAQIVMTSRAGSNRLHGTLYYYKRNQEFDSNDWFANSRGFGRGPEHQDRPGGVLGGPIVKDKTFFFVSVEKLNLLAPQSVIAEVPNLTIRNSVSASLRPFANAFPFPNGINLGAGAAEFRAVISNPAKDYAASLRLDHAFSPDTTFFLRYNLTPSNSERRGSELLSPSVITSQSSHSQTATAGLTHAFGSNVINDLRMGYSASSSAGFSHMDNYGGAVPLTDSQVFPAGVTNTTGAFTLNIIGVANYAYGSTSANNQQMMNVVDSVTKVSGKHHFKAGIDYRYIWQNIYRKPYTESVSFNGLQPTTTITVNNNYSFLSGIALNSQVSSNVTAVYPTYTNVSAYGEDMWRATDRTTLTYGLRWDLNPAPTTRKGQLPFALAASNIAGVTQNDPIYPTRWYDFAPRIGVAYLSDDTPGREMVLRAGAGLFYDLGYGVVGEAFDGAPYSSVRTVSQVPFPLSPGILLPPSLPASRPYGQVTTGSYGLKTPKILEWNGAWEKHFGAVQSVTVGITSTRGMSLMRTETAASANPFAYQFSTLLTNGASSSYNGLQVQYRRRLSAKGQAQVSYTWSHSSDSASSDAAAGGGFATVFTGGQNGPSDYDVRHNLTVSGSYQLPGPSAKPLSYLLKDWFVDYNAWVRSGLPFSIEGVSCTTSGASGTTPTSSTGSSASSAGSNTASCAGVSAATAGLFAQVRPDYNGGPIWLSDPKVPGGRRLNLAAFPLPSGFGQGNLGRNSLRGFSFSQLDLSLRRMIAVSERWRVNFAATGYNIFNHPNFANPTPFEGQNMSSPNFGLVTGMVNQTFGGGVNSLYRFGGSRSMEFSVRLQF